MKFIVKILYNLINRTNIIKGFLFLLFLIILKLYGEIFNLA